MGQASTIYGLNINFQVSSSVLGLNAFGLNQDDFAASDIPYSSGQATNTPNQPYEYMPDVAGGLSFMYNLSGNDSNRITSLVLNAHVADEIFLGEITYWDNPQIAALNPQLAGDLPAHQDHPRVPIGRLGRELPPLQLHAPSGHGQLTPPRPPPSRPSTRPRPTPCGRPRRSTSSRRLRSRPTYPGWAAGYLQGQNGSPDAADYVSASTSDGAITYVETAYAKLHNFPVASLVNASGAAVQPTSENVATALEDAILYPDLTQNLSGVYTNTLPNAYALSAYSYLVTPCSPNLAATLHQGSASCAGGPNEPSPFSSTKGQELGQFVELPGLRRPGLHGLPGLLTAAAQPGPGGLLGHRAAERGEGASPRIVGHV